ncbi:hypothetical protein Bpfe_015171, partial [Biomphalaria pfeifferi]
VYLTGGLAPFTPCRGVKPDLVKDKQQENRNEIRQREGEIKKGTRNGANQNVTILLKNQKNRE